MTDYAIVNPDDADDAYAGTDVPGEFRRLTEALGSEQLAATLIRVPPHSDFEQGTGHFHDEVEELYLVTRGTLTMRFGDEVRDGERARRRARRAADAALAPQRGRRAGRAVGRLAQARPRRLHEDRRVLGGLAARCTKVKGRVSLPLELTGGRDRHGRSTSARASTGTASAGGAGTRRAAAHRRAPATPRRGRPSASRSVRQRHPRWQEGPAGWQRSRCRSQGPRRCRAGRTIR